MANGEAPRKTRTAAKDDRPNPVARRGIGQLSLVEHALCPLDSRASLREDLHHVSEYRYTDAHGQSQWARVTVLCPAGLSSGDEYYLWGLLALTFAQPKPAIEFQATPHFCLRKLGLISPDSKGGKSYRLFRDALRRLSAVRYQNERFYDPLRREHRDVTFGFLSYSLPLEPDSSRAWRIVWDPLFFEFCQAAASQLSFDLEMYRKLDHASRRLFLLLSKVFWRRRRSPCFDTRHLAVHVLGFSGHLATRSLKAKVKRCAGVLQRYQLVAPAAAAAGGIFRKEKTGRQTAQFLRGAYFDQRRGRRKSVAIEDSPLLDPLCAIGFNMAETGRILARFPAEQIQLWADVTLAAVERKGQSFFRRSPQAFFMDSIQHAARGERTPPEWFWSLRHEEQQLRADAVRRRRQSRASARQLAASAENGTMPRRFNLDGGVKELTDDLLTHFLAVGQTEADARRNARRLAEELLWTRNRRRAT